MTGDYSRICHFYVSVADVRISMVNTIHTLFADAVTPCHTKISAGLMLPVWGQIVYVAFPEGK